MVGNQTGCHDFDIFTPPLQLPTPLIPAGRPICGPADSRINLVMQRTSRIAALAHSFRRLNDGGQSLDAFFVFLILI